MRDMNLKSILKSFNPSKLDEFVIMDLESISHILPIKYNLVAHASYFCKNLIHVICGYGVTNGHPKSS